MAKNIVNTKNISYKTLISQIATLQEKAETIRHKEKSSIVLGIKKKMNEYGITLSDLQIGGSSKKVSFKSSKAVPAVKSETPVKKATRRKPEPKYQDPKTGQTWTGRGKTPKWMQAAILKGKSKEKFAIR